MPSSFGVTRRHCRHSPVRSSTTAMTMSEKPSRHAAMARAFACERRTSGPLNETPMRARVRTSGARRSCDVPVGVTVG
jgi:hypothetical protein